MAGDDNAPRGEIKAAIAFVGRRVAKKDTGYRTGSQLVLCGGGEVRIAKTPKDTKIAVIRSTFEEMFIWDGITYG